MSPFEKSLTSPVDYGKRLSYDRIMVNRSKSNCNLPLLSISDLNKRWCYTKTGIHKLAEKEDFPKPIAKVNKGRVSIFTKDDIVAYEQDKPWLFSKSLKLSKQRSYFYLQQDKD